MPALAPAIGRRLAPLGLALSAIGYPGLGAATGGGTWSDAEALPLLALAGAGFGAGYSQVITRSIAGVAPEQAHDASGLFNTINMLGFALASRHWAACSSRRSERRQPRRPAARSSSWRSAVAR